MLLKLFYFLINRLHSVYLNILIYNNEFYVSNAYTNLYNIQSNIYCK